MNPADEPWEIAGDLTRKQYLTLAAVRSAGGEAQTADVTSSSEELYNELVNTHFRKMIDAGLLESVDRDGSDSSSAPPRKGYTYRITDRGREVLTAAQEDYGFDPLQEGAIREHFDRIEERLESVEQEVQGQREGDDGTGDLEAEVAALEERLNTLEENQDLLVDDLRKVADFLEETREEIGLGGFWENE